MQNMGYFVVNSSFYFDMNDTVVEILGLVWVLFKNNLLIIFRTKILFEKEKVFLTSAIHLYEM